MVTENNRSIRFFGTQI